VRNGRYLRPNASRAAGVGALVLKAMQRLDAWPIGDDELRGGYGIDSYRSEKQRSITSHIAGTAVDARRRWRSQRDPAPWHRQQAPLFDRRVGRAVIREHVEQS
jgi:hypothetical protein